MTANHSSNTDLLFEHFSTLATAPDGIARLRELILQLAVQGKLGTQDPGDETASVLLKRIEKERIASEGKNKKEKSLDPVKDSDVGFQIPDTWVLTRLGNIAQYNAETKTSANEISDDAWVFDLEDIEKDTSRILQKVRFKDRRSLSTKSRFRKGDILYGKLRPYLNKVVVADEDGYCTTEIVPIRPYGKIFPQFLMYALKTPDFLSYVNSKTYGIKMPRLGTVDALNTIIPLPPLAEQHRIVAKVDRLMALCDELEARQQQERAGCLKLGTASLAGLQNAESPEEFEAQWAQVCDAFDLILDCPENVAVLRQTVLQLAVQGRLVRQEPVDEPVGKLVERIRNEKERLVKEGKIKREKPLDPLDRTTISFKIPESWSYKYLNDICELVVDPDHNMPKAVETGVKFISSKDLNDEGIINFSRNIKLISEEDYSRLAKKFQPKRGDILFARIGARIGKPCIVDSDERFMISYSCCVIRPLFVDRKYVNYFLKEASFLAIAYQKTVGVGVPDLGMKMIKQFVVPLPPLAEQHRIVAKVDALMALCDALESRLKERAGVQSRFADSIVKMVGGENA